MLARRGAVALDPESEAAARGVLRATAAANLFLLASLAPVAEGFETAGLRWAALKGVDHLARLYPGPEWREMTDVDLLVHPGDLAAALRVLEAAGFAPWTGTPAVQPGLCLSKDGASIDLHRRLVRRGGFIEDLEWVLGATAAVDLEGCPVRVLAPAQALAAHALLLAKDWFCATMIRAERVVELGLLADAAGSAGEVEAWERLESWGAGRVAACACEVVAWLRGGPRPGWADAGFGGAEAGFGRPPAMMRRLLRGAWLQGSAGNAVPWVLAQAWSFGLQRMSGRRWGRWELGA